MKLILTAVGATALAGALMLHQQPDPAPFPDYPIQIVAGRGSPLIARPAPAFATTSGELQTAPAATVPASTTTDPDATSLNTARSDEPFASQHRSPEWAGYIESLVGRHLPRGGSITCAEYMCKATVPLLPTDTAANSADAGDDVDGADQRAVLATQNWPNEIAYNSQTAQVVRGPAGSFLTFLVTRNQWPETEESKR